MARQRDLAGVREELADARVEAARASADVSSALAQRDAATARAEEVEALRQATVDQFRLLSSEVASRIDDSTARVWEPAPVVEKGTPKGLRVFRISV